MSEVELGDDGWTEADIEEELKMPKTRGDCAHGPSPCIHLRCKWHLIWAHVKIFPLLHRLGQARSSRVVDGQIDPDPKYQEEINRIKDEIEETILETLPEMKYSCTLDVTDGTQFQDVYMSDIAAAEALGVSRQRIHQMIAGGDRTWGALEKVRRAGRKLGLCDYKDHCSSSPTYPTHHVPRRGGYA